MPYLETVLLGGRLADTIGRRRTFLIGLALLTLASLGPGLADSGALLVAAQGIDAAVGVLCRPPWNGARDGGWFPPGRPPATDGSVFAH